MIGMREDKKQKFMQEYIEASRKKRKKIIIVSVMAVILAVGGIWYSNSGPYKSDDGGNYFVEETPSYKGKKVEMSLIEAEQKDGKIMIPLSEVVDKKIVRFEYKDSDPEHVFYGQIKGKMPIMAFLTTAGRVVVASSICEPCYGTEFYFQDDSLVCVACGTRWRNTDLFGEAGGCVKYPPEELKYTVEGDKIVLPESVIKDWQPRFFTEDVMG
ncbi:hypothetical protein Tfer_0789 [Thermincola ferriacetica]|uniref:Membrane iron-sulfur containing protein FtrD-like domain-containing protein n=2 Tax=Thermincola ferriacetica TaxID=281456 RepID=A0A0L6W4Z4_9FIRM|nr:hypothetical protein Tfer_0789 [Thermincola ferriacetica]